LWQLRVHVHVTFRYVDVITTKLHN
jgi:hypothetical protein